MDVFYEADVHSESMVASTGISADFVGAKSAVTTRNIALTKFVGELFLALIEIKTCFIRVNKPFSTDFSRVEY